MGVHESLDAGGQSQLRKWKHRRSVQVSIHVPPKNHMHGCSELFSLGLPYICLGEQTCRVKGSNGAWGGDRSVGPADKGGSKEGKGKRIAQALGELGARLQGSTAGWWKLGGRKDHDRRKAEQAQQQSPMVGPHRDRLHAKAFEISDSVRIRAERSE